MFNFKSNLKQLALLSWKNYTIQKRSLIGLTLELLLPAVFAIILLPIRGLVKSTNYKNTTIYDAFEINKMANFSTVLPATAKAWYISYSPSNDSIADEIMKLVVERLSLGSSGKIYLQKFETEEEMSNKDNFLYKTNSTNFTMARIAGVAFLNTNNLNLTYKLRLSYSPKAYKATSGNNYWITDLIYPQLPSQGPREFLDKTAGSPGYYREAFLTIQNAIETTFIGLVTNDTDTEKLLNLISLKRFPFPPWDDDQFKGIIQGFLPFILMISFIFTVIFTARSIVIEKETGLKEAMKMVGMKPWIYWLSWYIKTFCLLLPAAIFTVIAYKIKIPVDGGGKAAILDKTDTLILFIFILLYMSSTITFTLLLSSIFKKAGSAAAGSGFIWFLTYIPFYFIQIKYDSISSGLKILAAFVNNLGMSESLFLIGSYESKGVGVNWSNINEPVSVNDTLTFTHLMLISLSTNFFHLLIFFYLEQINPGDNGIAKKWYFPIQCLFPSRKTSEDSFMVNKIYDSTKERTDSSQVFIESDEVYATRKAGIKINNITKVFKQFGKLKTAVNDLSFKIYENHITVLLGHNGAGKSTTISMITGIASPTKGQILVNDHDIVNETQLARKQIGYCPQYNLLFDEMTVLEHLVFFSKLKENHDPKEIENILTDLNLSDKTNALSRTLSGGMKRKLSVAIAFIGGSKIVILDEPTSGMDPQARHSTWTVLQKFKQEKQCSILLTTHFMDEADFLGDRIAIMSRGSLRCCGSPLYLKSKYDSGYNLVINKKTSNKTSKAINDDPSVNKFMSIIQKHVQNAQLNSNINNEISFMLPKEQTPKFAALFSDLEQYKEELNIINVGVSVTTVEEVFLKIGDLEECEELDAVEESTLNNNVAILDVKTTDDFGLYAGVNAEERNDSIFFKYYQQFYGLVIKKMIHSIRYKLNVIFQLVLPIVSLLFALVLLKFGPISLKDSASLPISLKPYRSNYVPFKVFGGNDSLAANLSTAYQNQFDSNALDLNFGKLENCSTSTNDIDNYMTCIGQLPNVGISLITDNYIVGATFETNGSNITKITGHFNNQPYHAPPLTLNLITNSILKMRTNSPKAQINVINHPMPRTLDEEATEERGLGVVGGFQISGMITIGFSFLIASFASFLIKERVSNAKHMQYLTGANPVVFWISNLAWDFVNYLVPAVICILLIVLFDVKQLGGSQLQYMFGLFFLYGWANIPLTYLLAYIFKSPSTGFAIIVILYLLTSQASIVAVNVLTLPGIDLKDVADVLEWLFLILLPNFSFGQGITDIYQNYEFTGICKKVIDQLPPNIPLEFACLALPNPCCIGLESGCGVDDKNKPIPCLPWNKNYMAWEKPGLGRYFTFMTLQFVVLFSLVFIYELGLLRKIFYVIKTLFCSSPSEESQNIDIHYKQKAEEELFGDIQKDSDVLEEENRIKTEKNDLLCIDQLTKYYGDFMAVKGISVGIQPGECFGLLGVNGAGKTTTFKMITGDELITKGDVLLNRTSIKRDINTYQKQIGYCPQFDPLIERMTTLETLYLFARLRGIKENLIKRTCLSIISMLDLSDHTEKMVQTLSGGNKRKLSVGIALIGSPKIVLLDEPTSGMDPRTRRFLWNCLNNIREKGKSLILTSHSMEETEALCTRMGIMVNGELKCLGNLQHLKSVYGEGYTLLVKITQTQKEINKVANSFIQTVKSKFANSILKENRDGFVNIQILDNSIRMLGSIFTLIEDIKVEYSIEYYFVTQTKLEQIFLNFAGKQIEPSSRYLANKKACLFC